MSTDVIFTVTNELTGVRADVIGHGGEFYTVEMTDVDSHEYVGSRTFQSESKAISHAVLIS